ncbi:DKNYY family protein [Thalassolituus maritimus]|jgi:hypothetical protein|uniref:DKNYY family protein n=1 Tax=Thalassolituus maritimus TaxID=484498 RepID=A0A1N7NMJ1_9GAMM|nr:DKNYY domain-containing protein [Thalassolituus maritimus]SIS99605.1 DKNYY family protein [Thalassolituus maritimus]
MGLLGNILVTFALMLWPMVWIVSIMGMGGPGASNRLDWMIQLLVYMSYPIWMFGLLSLAGKSFWGLASGYFLIGCLVLFIIFNAGMFRSISNLLQGIRNEGYSVAKSTAYFNAKPIVEADAKSFDTFKGDLSYFFAYHAWDNEHTYYRGEVVEGAPGGPLEALNDLSRSRDYVASGETVIYGNTVLRGCSLSHLEFFEDIEKYWARCGEKIYYAGNIVEGADAQSFTPLNSWLAHDNYRFYECTEVTDTTADASSFQRIDGGYYRDHHRIFYLPDSTIQEVEGVDLNTFEVVYEVLGEVRSDARDAHSRYYNGERVSSH